MCPGQIPGLDLRPEPHHAITGLSTVQSDCLVCAACSVRCKCPQCPHTLLCHVHTCVQVRGWTLRQVTPLSSAVQRVPYPIPPAGADPATYRAEEEPPPLGFTYVVSVQLGVGFLNAGPAAKRTSGVSQEGETLHGAHLCTPNCAGLVWQVSLIITLQAPL